MNPKVVYVLAPHADDAEISCGGTIAKFSEQGAKVYVSIFAKSIEQKEDVSEAGRTLGIKKYFFHDMKIRHLGESRQRILDKLIEMRTKLNPDLVIMPSLTDIHQDHKVIAEEGLRAFKNTTVIGFETCWNNLNFDAQLFVILKPEHVEKKIKAVECFKTQGYRLYTNPDYTRSLLRVRGVQIGREYAEMFSVIRQVA